MKPVRTLWLGLLLTATALLGNVYATEDWKALQRISEPYARYEMIGNAFAEEEWKALYGEAVKFDIAQNEIVVNVPVTGILGPGTKEMPFKLDKDTMFHICVTPANECYTAIGNNGWDIVQSIEGITSFSVLDKDVTLIKNMLGQITHVEIIYF